ncbi:methyltransferase domain-containing protein [Thermoproteota archaeon]
MFIGLLRILFHPFYLILLWPLNLAEYFRCPGLYSDELYLFLFYFFKFSLKEYEKEKETIIQNWRSSKELIQLEKESSGLTYGELMYASLRRAMKYVTINENSIFLDLGCGKGKLVFFVRQCYNIPSIGIDIIPTFIKTAQHRVTNKKYKAIRFIEQDFLEHKLPPATIVLVSATCMNDHDIQTLKQHFNALDPGAYVLSTSSPIEMPDFKLIKELMVPFTWGWGHIYVQQKTSLL